MIVVDSDTTFMLISQHEHAHLATQLAQFWRSPVLRDRIHFDDLLFAIREHDNGWQELDSTPMWNTELERPHDFLSLPEKDRHELWRRGTLRFASQNPYASALIAQHAHRLLDRDSSRSSESLRSLLDELVATRDSILKSLEVTLDEFHGDYLYLELVDLISLMVCSQVERESHLHGYEFALVRPPIEGSSGVAVIDPFPFAGTTTFSFRARSIGRRVYKGDADLASTTITAPFETVSIQFAPRRRGRQGSLQEIDQTVV